MSLPFLTSIRLHIITGLATNVIEPLLTPTSPWQALINASESVFSVHKNIRIHTIREKSLESIMQSEHVRHVGLACNSTFTRATGGLVSSSHIYHVNSNDRDKNNHTNRRSQLFMMATIVITLWSLEVAMMKFDISSKQGNQYLKKSPSIRHDLISNIVPTCHKKSLEVGLKQEKVQIVEDACMNLLSC